MSDGEHDQRFGSQPIPVAQSAVPATPLAKNNPYGVGISADSESAPEQEDLTRYQTLRTGLVLIVSGHFGHISMVLLMMYVIFMTMNIGASLGGAVGGGQGAEVGGEVGGMIGGLFATCCAWFFFIVTAPLNFIGGCLGFSVPDITGAKSKITGSVVAGALSILCWVGLFLAPEFAIANSGLGFFLYMAIVLISVFASHAFFVWALHDIGKYLGRRELCSGGFATVAVSGLCFLLFIAGLGILMQIEGWKDSELPGAASGMWLLSGVLALVWLVMYIRLLFIAMSALKLVGPSSRVAVRPTQPIPVQPYQSGVPVAQTPSRKGW